MCGLIVFALYMMLVCFFLGNISLIVRSLLVIMHGNQ